MFNKIPVLLLLTSSLLLSACTPLSDATPPTVVFVSPENGDAEVDADTSLLSVSFNEKMMDQSWSFAYLDESKFPTLTGDPSYDSNLQTVQVPVKLEPGKDYEIWLNSESYHGFKDANGNELEPYVWTFSTKE